MKQISRLIALVLWGALVGVLLSYASILEKPQYVFKNGVKHQIPTGEVVEAACVALRLCAALFPWERAQ